MYREPIRGVVLHLPPTHTSNLAEPLLPGPQGLQSKETTDEVWDLQSTRMRHGHTDDAKPGFWSQTASKVEDVDGHKCRATRHP